MTRQPHAVPPLSGGTEGRMREIQQDSSSNASRAVTRDHSLAAPKAAPSAAHTPGPWKIEAADVESDGSVYPARIVGGQRELVICYLTDLASDAMWESADDVRSKAANARLIAAAPELYEALEPFALVARQIAPSLPGETVVEMRIGDRVIYSLALDSLCATRAAIAKAEGGQ